MDPMTQRFSPADEELDGTYVSLVIALGIAAVGVIAALVM